MGLLQEIKMENTEEPVKISFKSSKKRQVRKRRNSSDEEDEASQEFNKNDYEKTRELQKLRKRTAGTNVVTLASGKKITKVEDVITADDPFKTKTGGLVDMKAMKGVKPTEDSYEVGTQFSKETHIRDEDDELRKFIDTEMEKIKGQNNVEYTEAEYVSPEDAALLSLPEHLRKSTFKKDQQMLSAQMLSGIPEVDLGIEAKIQNIERTEKAKRMLLEEAKLGNKNGKDKSLASQYVQHDRYTIEQSTTIGREKERKKEPEKVDRPATVNIYQEEDDNSSRNILQRKSNDQAALHNFKQRN